MSLGMLATIAEQAPANFYHFLLDNEVYATTGGQPVPNAKNIAYDKLALASGYPAGACLRGHRRPVARDCRRSSAAPARSLSGSRSIPRSRTSRSAGGAAGRPARATRSSPICAAHSEARIMKATAAAPVDAGTFDYIVAGAGSAGCCVAAGSARAAATGCCCSRPAPTTAIGGSMCRSGTAGCSPTRRSTGCSRASPSPSSKAARCTSRAARCWAAPARSTAWSTCAATRPITICGGSAAAPAGTGTACCRISARPRTRSAAPIATHGAGGPLRVSDQAVHWELGDHFIEAAQQAGLPLNNDFNDGEQEGAGPFQNTTNRKRRWSTATAYLKPARSRANLAVRTNAHATRILVEDGRAAAVEFLCDGVPHVGAGARRDRRVRRRLRLAAAVAAFGDRPRRSAASSQHPGDARPARRRRRSAGPFLCPHDLPLHRAAHPQRHRQQPGEEADRRHAVRVPEEGAADQQRHLRRRLRPQRPAARPARHPAQFQRLELCRAHNRAASCRTLSPASRSARCTCGRTRAAASA